MDSDKEKVTVATDPAEKVLENIGTFAYMIADRMLATKAKVENEPLSAN
jgi:hypothetical protein